MSTNRSCDDRSIARRFPTFLEDARVPEKFLTSNGKVAIFGKRHEIPFFRVGNSPNFLNMFCKMPGSRWHCFLDSTLRWLAAAGRRNDANQRKSRVSVIFSATLVSQIILWLFVRANTQDHCSTGLPWTTGTFFRCLGTAMCPQCEAFQRNTEI